MYTYDDYLKKKQEYGFASEEISDADDRLAQSNPDAGMALLGYKNDWKTATNDSARAMAHAGAEDIRSRYGSYTGGETGGSFVPTGTAGYEDPWEESLRSTIRSLENRKFEWSPETDPTAKYYEDMYRREGERAMKDTLGAVAATTGGIPSSYATAAAAQQRNYYAQQLTDKYPELYQQAYENFLKEYDREYQMLDAYAAMSDTGYGRWSDQQERDRLAREESSKAIQQAFENQLALDELAQGNRQLDITENQYGEQNKIAWAELGMKDAQFNADMDYKYAALDQNDQQFIKEMLYKYDVLDADNAYKYAALAQDKEIADKELQYRYDQLSEQGKQFVKEMTYKYDALTEDARQYDLSLEQQMIIAEMEDQLARDKITASKDAEKLEMATVAASYGDFSALKALGYDVSKYEDIWNKQMDEALNPEVEDEGTEEDVINNMAGQAGGENIMKKNEPRGYDLNASVIDQLAAEAPTYKAKADAEKAAQNAQNEEDYGKKYASYLAGNKLTNEEKKNLDYTLDNWIKTYRSGGDLTDEAKSVVERYNSESTMQDLFDQYMDGKYMLPTEEKMMKSFVENAYNKYLLGQKVTPTEERVLGVWLNGRKTKVGKYW